MPLVVQLMRCNIILKLCCYVVHAWLSSAQIDGARKVENASFRFETAQRRLARVEGLAVGAYNMYTNTERTH